MASMYDISIPVFVRGLNNISASLKKAERWAEENGVFEDKLTEAKLVEDMLPLTFQVQCCSDTSKLSLVRLTGAENVPMEDTEKTFAELYQRIEKTIEGLSKAQPNDFGGKESAEVVMKTRRGVLKFTGVEYMTLYALPNFFFHESMVYAILRSLGIPLGKWDFLGRDGYQVLSEGEPDL